MINNYLYFAKAERKRLLKESKKRFRDSTGETDEWLTGYDRGWSCAQLCASWRWRKLQKDIEAIIKVCEKKSPEDEALYIADRFY